MILNAHSYYSLRYGTYSVEELVKAAKAHHYEAIALTDINNSTGMIDFVKACEEEHLRPIAGMEFQRDDRLLYIAIARNNEGFSEINTLLSNCNIDGTRLPDRPEFMNAYIIYPYGHQPKTALRDNEFIGVTLPQINKVLFDPLRSKFIIQHAITHKDSDTYEVHQKLRAVHHNLLLSQLEPWQIGTPHACFIPQEQLLETYERLPQAIENTRRVMQDCRFSFDFSSSKNKKTFTGSRYEDRLLLEKLAYAGMLKRYGTQHERARERIRKELEIIDALNFSSYFLITQDIVQYSLQKDYYHVGRGSGANSVVAYCLQITDVCPIELDLYFERFLNPKRKNPPDFDLDYCWKERDDVLDYIFGRYGRRHTALLGTVSTFKDRSIIRELGKVHGLPKDDIDRLVRDPNSPLNDNAICREVLNYYRSIENYPNLRSIHAGGVLISEEPLSYYSALDMPPKGYPTSQFDMYMAEDIGFEKLDILSQRGIGHIRDATQLIEQNQGIKVDFREVQKFKNDPKVRELLMKADTMGCFYIESPAMRGLLKKLECDNYLTLVAASSIIRPGVAKSGMMKEYIFRHRHPDAFEYMHPLMKEHLHETYGVMVYQEDVMKVGHYFGGLDMADADYLRRMMSGKSRNNKQLEAIRKKFFEHCAQMGHPENSAHEVWRQMESFAGFSFNKAHSASYAVESYQSLYLKAHYPLEFIVAVINNFGGFYATRVYVNEVRKAGGQLHLPCVNNSLGVTSLKGRDVYLGFGHVKSLEQSVAGRIEAERQQQGPFRHLEDFILRTGIGLEQLRILIRIDALRFTGRKKHQLLWEANMLYNKTAIAEATMPSMFEIELPHWELPELESNPIKLAYDEMELLEFPVTLSEFDLLKTSFRGECKVNDMMQHVGQTVRMVGNYVAHKHVYTMRNERMAFGTFADDEGHFFDTVSFPPSLRDHPFKGWGVYLLLGKIVAEFGFPTLEVEKMAKLPIHGIE